MVFWGVQLAWVSSEHN
ncbi:hypothetical protein PENARI_c005G00119 [Penicillium arizonense]|uniref:Uncharacterized protein n=1 Tax=Penicillium arizonense TaxID=1835702 RepID=A0A1F5LPB5_PENAI|nr:hypothetical protein PENARI_c005G00119 [Penicillium arizonense]